MSSPVISRQQICGLLELDAAGTVLYSSVERNVKSNDSTGDVVGHNFYSEVAPFINVEEFQQHLDNFNRSGAQAHGFAFTCHYADGAVPVRVLLARVRDHANRSRTNSLLIHIRKAEIIQ